MSGIIEIPLEAIGHAAFEPFGQIVGHPGGAPGYIGNKLESWRMEFAAEGPTEMMFSRYFIQPLEFSRLERHFSVTQAFLPLGGSPWIMVVAPPTDPANQMALPDPADVRAFLVGGGEGVMMWRGTWHALDRFPVEPPHADFALITASETQRELERQNAEGISPRLTQEIDFQKDRSLGFRIVDRDGLLASG